MKYFAYELATQLDFHSPYFTVDQMKAMIKRNVDGYINDELTDIEFFFAELDKAVAEGSNAIYNISVDSELRQPVKVFPMPSHIPGVALYGIILKFDNNGTSYVAVPMEIPYYNI